MPLASSQQNLYDIYLLLCIQYQTLDDGQKTCPKHVEFYSKNKFKKLAHLVGFIIRIYPFLFVLYILICYTKQYPILYRVIHEIWTSMQMQSKKVSGNMAPILNVYGAMGGF
jgi:hypothetical protein